MEKSNTIHTIHLELGMPLWAIIFFVLAIGGFCFLIQYATYLHLTRKETTETCTKADTLTNQSTTKYNHLPNLPGIPLWYCPLQGVDSLFLTWQGLQLVP
ncbi:hypothetical protein [Chitinophaga niabensis]|uniref:Uncharacterized protein n=1 Tax=Chitinophaga niabensis TaxID=536979 RepID=A0A1N6DHK1_9BACT|nr:hypothetical protein [Chitinophaga niabensis]SIN70281.1 hypothetical protein SAMN04488055_0759 [Chitinophaga niabensis]